MSRSLDDEHQPRAIEPRSLPSIYSSGTAPTATRILVTGSRDWLDADVIHAALKQAWAELCPPYRDAHGVFTRDVPTLVDGACPTGADLIAHVFARRAGWRTERHPAEWWRHDPECPRWHANEMRCHRAGYRRNAEMVKLGADICLAFIKDASPGATQTATLAARAGMPVRRFTFNTAGQFARPQRIKQRATRQGGNR
jgi:hypothetical protein